MPIRKFRSVADMECDLWRDPDDPDLRRAIAGVWELAARTSRLRFPPGVYKHRSIEESDRQREAWEAASLSRRESE